MRTLRHILDAAASICMLVAAVSLLWNGAAVGKSARVSADSAAISDVEDQHIYMTLQPKSGGQAGRLVIFEFADFQCPFCGQYARSTFATVKRNLVDSGRVHYEFVHFPLRAIHAMAFEASQAAECARAQGHFWDMHRVLFANQNALAHADLVNYARELGLRMAEFESCLSAEATAATVRRDVDEGERAGVSSTPTFLLGRIEGDKARIISRIAGAAPYQAFESAVSSAGAPKWSKLWKVFSD
jgi:protein-disulfide isomerase